MQPGNPYLTAPVPPQRKRRAWPWVLLAVGVVIVLCGGLALATLATGAKSVNDQIEHGSTDLMADVKITSCKRDSLGFAKVDFTVTNSGDGNQSYWIQFAIKDKAGTRLAEAHGIVNNLGPGASAKESTVASVETSTMATCVVERVN